MAKKYKFVGKKTVVSDNESFNQNVESKVEEKIYDLADFSIQQLVSNLQKDISKRPSWFIFLRLRHQEKIRIGTEQIKLLTEQLIELRHSRLGVARLQADEILTKDTIDHLVQLDREDFKRKLRERAEEHKTLIHAQKHARKLKDRELKKLDTEIRKTAAEAEMQEAMNKSIDKLGKEELAFVFKEFIGRNKPFATADDYNSYVEKKEQREHDKEMSSIETDLAKQQRQSGAASTAQDMLRAKIKIEEEGKNPDDYIQKYDRKSEKE